MIRALLWIAPSWPAQARAQMNELVGGVRLLERQLRLLRAVGAAEVAVACPNAWQAEMREAAGPLAGAAHWLDAIPDAAAQWAANGEGAWVLRAEALFERRVFAPLRRTGEVVGATLAVAVDGASGEARGGAWVSPEGDELLAAFLADERAPVAARQHVLGPGDWVGHALDAEARVHAEHLLWEGCRKPLDGIVARHLNRHISLFLSRRIAASPITPNQISVLNVLLGLGAALLAAQGGYAAVLMGAILLQANSVLDGVDGELARMRIQSSVLGEWLDTISDDVSNQGFFAGLAWGAHVATGHALWLWLGGLTVIPMLATSAYYYALLIKKGRGDLLAIEWFQRPARPSEQVVSVGERILDVVTVLFRRDSFVLMLAVAAFFAVAPYALFATAPSAVGLLVSLVVRRPRAR